MYGMLRSKKFNVLKHIGLNSLFDFCTEDHLESKMELNTKDIYDDITIKSNDTHDTHEYKYELIKEVVMEPYIFKLNDILLIHIKDNLIDDFEFLYKKSQKYVFDIYETTLPNLKEESYIKMYHVFCISKKLLSNVNYMSFLRANDSDKKYYCLSLFYGPCLIVNKRFDITCEQDKYESKYKYLKTIGKGKIDNSIRSFVKFIIDMTNEYQKMLPPHYLKIN
jgi:hypothetical protein